jgi:hypothetical protein
MLEPILNPDFSPEQMQLVSDIAEKLWNDNGRWQDEMIEPYTDHVMESDEIATIRQEMNLEVPETVTPQEQWDENVFEYQGYHFEPVGVLPHGLEGKELVNLTRGNTELHLSTYEREDDILYSYAGFYEASGATKADIFQCMETGRNYIPGENELFGYEGEFLPYLQNEQEEKIEPHNFRITDDELGAGGPKAKFKANMEAIRLLKKLEQEQRRLVTMQARIPALVHRKLSEARFTLLTAQKDLSQVTQNLLSRQRYRLELLQQRVADNSPEKLLSRGYSITLKDGKAVTDASLLQPGDQLTTRLLKGEVQSTVR